jgi:hypothetical protein
MQVTYTSDQLWDSARPILDSLYIEPARINADQARNLREAVKATLDAGFQLGKETDMAPTYKAGRNMGTRDERARCKKIVTELEPHGFLVDRDGKRLTWEQQIAATHMELIRRIESGLDSFPPPVAPEPFPAREALEEIERRARLPDYAGAGI